MRNWSLYWISSRSTTWKFCWEKAKLGREDIFKPTSNESLHEISNDNGVTEVHLTTPEYLIIKSKVFPRRDIHKYIWISNRKMHKHIYIYI